MASKAQNASASSRTKATDKNSGSVKVVMPDQNGDFAIAISHNAVEKVEVVDVDMVLQLKDGTSLVLAGGALSAMDASKTDIKFSDGIQGLSQLLDQVGTIEVQKLDPLVSSLQASSGEAGQAAGSDSHESIGSTASQIGNQLTQILQSNAQSVTMPTLASGVHPLASAPDTNSTTSQPLQHQQSPFLPERQGVVPQQTIPPEETPTLAPDTAAMTLSLVNLTTITQIGNTLYGSGGTPNSATDASNVAQFAPQVINAPADATIIHAISNIPPNDFIKVVNMQLTGDGITQAITVKNVPTGMSIANGTDLGGGNWSIAVVSGQRTYDLQLEYTTAPADANSPIHAQFALEFNVSVSTVAGIQTLSQIKQFVVKDVHSANDLTFIDSSTGESVYVLPAQGNSHIIHAGDAGVTIFGSNAADLLYGGAGADTINGGSGNTYFEGGGGADHLNGGSGINTVGYGLSTTGVTVNLATGAGLSGDAQGDVLVNMTNAVGSAYDDTIVSSAIANNIDGGAGGSDTVSYAASNAGVTVDLSTGTGNGGFAAGDKLIHIQNVIGSDFNDTFISSTAANAFQGGLGVNTVNYANEGTGVIVDLSTGAQTGGAASGDTYNNIQNVIGTAFDDTFVSNTAANRFDGGLGGQDTVSYLNSATGVTVNFVTGRGTSGDAAGDSYINIQNVIGSSHDDIFVANIDSKTFNGGSGGMDTVNYLASGSAVTIDAINNIGHGGFAEGNSYANIQKFVGTSYDDIFIASASANQFDGGVGGVNTVDYSNSNAAVTVNLFNGTSSGGFAAGDVLTQIQNVTGSNFDDIFIASNDQNKFEGGSGINTVSYENSNFAVTVDLSNSTGAGTAGGFALGDTFSRIQNVTGSQFNDTFVASGDANVFDGGISDASSHNRVSYASAAAAVTVDLTNTAGAGTSGGAAGDSFINIQDVTGSQFDDTFVASTGANNFDGGASTATSHNRVSYASAVGAVTVDLTNTTGAGTSGGAAGDTFVNIQDITGTVLDDTFVASAAANFLDGGAGSLHNRASYAGSNAGVTVDLNVTDGTGTSGGFATGDHLANIQDLVGSALDDTFVASTAANNFDGGVSTATSHNRVSYASAAAAVTVDLTNTTGAGTSGGAAGDTFVNIQDVTGTMQDDTFIASAAANFLDGGAGSLHNRASYAGSNAGVTVDLNFTDGTGTSGGFATGDHLANIQDVSGSTFDDTFVASTAANNFDGGASTATSHNRVSYASTGTAVTVDLSNATGAGTSGGAAGDTFINIQDITGTAQDDTFIANAATNFLDGGASTSASHNRVSYVNSGASVTVDLNFTDGSGTSGGFATGDHLVNIQDVTGSNQDDTFVASASANNFDGGVSTVASHNRVSYASSNAGVAVDLNATDGSGTSGGFAMGDHLINIQDLIGSNQDDTFVASTAANNFDGGISSATSHNRVSYAQSLTAVSVDLTNTTGSGTSGGAAGDTFVNIQDLTGSALDDTFVASTAANNFDGGASTGASHNRVSYALAGTAVTIDLSNIDGTGTSGGAAGDTFVNIQDITGTAQDDTFIASAAANFLDGGTSTAASHNRVSYVNSDAGVLVDLNATDGSGTSGGFAAGDHLANIQDLTGSASDDTFIASTTANNFDGGASTATSHNRVSYASTGTAVTVDLTNTIGTGTSGGAAGDTFINIQDVTGTALDDTFIASAVANNFDGGASTATSHNRVSYATTVAAVTVDLSNTSGSGTSGGAAGDTFVNIQDITGTAQDDIFVASAAANFLNGGTGSAHNRASYASSNAGVAVDLNFTDGTGTSGGFAAGDRLVNIQDLTGSAFDDSFVAGTVTSIANNFDGGASTATSHNRVSYAGTATAVTIDLTSVTGSGTSGGALGDTFVNIQDLTGTSLDDMFVASAAANFLDGGSGSLHNRVSYASTATGAAGVTVDLNATDGSGTSGGFAAGDRLANVQDLTGSAFDDTFVASTAANNFDGGTSTAASHNRVSYAQSLTAVTVDLTNTTGAGTSGGAAGDTFVNVQDLTGTVLDDTFIASAAANFLDGGSGSLHNRVSYASTATGAAGVTVDLNAIDGSGTSGGFAAGDRLANVQDLTGSNFDDTFVASTAANNFDGGTSTATSHNRVSYAQSLTAVTVDLTNTTGAGTSGGAAGDTFINIQDLTGSASDDTFVASTAANNFDGGISTAASHNRVSYAGTVTAVTVDLTNTTGAGTSGGAAGDTFANVQDLSGTLLDDTFVASAAANFLDGGTGSLHNRVSYASTATGAAGVTVDLNFTDGTGTSGGFAAGDRLANVQDLTGSSFDDTFVASTAANNFDGGTSTATSHNRVSYASIATGVTVDLTSVTGSGTLGGALGDTFVNIQDLTGTAQNDVFIASAAANFLDGGTSTGTSHNRVGYGNSDAGVTVDLNAIDGTGTSGGFAAGDRLANIQDLTGSAFDDTFVANTANNNFDGGTGTVHNRVSYAQSLTGVTVDLATGASTAGGALGDTFVNIQDLTGSAQDDTFIAGTVSTVANNFDGGVSTATSHNRVSYAGTAAPVTVDLTSTNGSGSLGGALGDTFINIQDITGTGQNDGFFANAAANFLDGAGGIHNRVSYGSSNAAVTVDLNFTDGTGTSGGFAAGDHVVNIQDLTGSNFGDTFIASSVANRFDGGAGFDTVSYAASTAAVIANLSNITGVGTSGGYAAGDTFINVENLTGSAFSDTFVASTLANIFNGGSGGSDTVSYQSSLVGVTVNLSTGVAGIGGDAAGDTYINISNLIGSTLVDRLTGLTGGNSTLTGGAGADVLIGLGSNNTADYSASTAVTINLQGGTGVGGDAQGDTLTGIQNVIGGVGDDFVYASSVANIINGGTGTNTVSYEKQNGTGLAGVTVDLTTNTGSGVGTYAAGDTYINIQNAIGTDHADTLKGLTAGGSILTGGAGADTLIGSGSGNTASYVGSTAVTIDLVNGTGLGGDAAGDILSGIQNLTGGTGADRFILNHGANIVDGGNGSDTVSYEFETTNNVTVNLATETAGGGFASGTGNFGANDIFTSIENAIGGGGNDIFIAGSKSNAFDGRTGTDTVSYALYAPGGNSNGVTVDLFAHTGSGGWANGDTYTSIENVIGTNGNDIFIDAADGVANIYNGGVNGASSEDSVNYQNVSAASPLTVSLSAAHANAGSAVGDTYINIIGIIGSSFANTTLWGDSGSNDLIAMGTTNTNVLNGLGSGTGGLDYLDGRLGGHNTLIAGDTGSTIFAANASGSALASNIDSIVGSTVATTTLTMSNLGATLDLSTFSAGNRVSHITTLDLQDGSATGTNVSISANDVLALGNNKELSVKVDNNDSISLVTLPNQHATLFGNGDYAFFDANNVELARIHQLH